MRRRCTSIVGRRARPTSGCFHLSWSINLKRAFDIALSGIGLICSLPVWALCAMAIKLEDGGAVFFRQGRVGLGGRQRAIAVPPGPTEGDGRAISGGNSDLGVLNSHQRASVISGLHFQACILRFAFQA